MNGKSGFTSMQILTLFKEQSNQSIAEMFAKRSIYLLNQLKISSRTLFKMKQFFVMLKIQGGLVTKLKSNHDGRHYFMNHFFKS